MPNRIIREGILDSREVNNLPESSEILYRRLMSIVDDFGRFEADPELIRARCFARQLERWPLERVTQCLSDISKTSLVTFYSVNGKNYLEFNKFNQRSRSAAKFPGPDDGQLTVIWQSVAGINGGHTNLPSPSPSPNNEYEQRFRTSNTKTRANSSKRFDEFWKLYPVKEGEMACAGVWMGLVTVENEEQVFDCLGRYLASERCANAPKNPNNWLHDCSRDGWKNEWPLAVKAKATSNGKSQVQEMADAAREILERQKRHAN